MIKYEEPADWIDSYLGIYDTVQGIKADLAQANQELARAKEELLAYMAANGLDSIGRGERSISAHKRSFGKVTDFAELMAWVLGQDEPSSEYIQESFIKGSTKDPRGIHRIIADAQAESVETDRPLADCLPEGLEIATVDVVTVRTRRQREVKEPTTALDKLGEAF